jgi:serine/threonine protein kinase
MAAANANATPENFFLTEYGEAQRYTIKEVIGKGSYGVVCSAIDNNSGTSSALDEREMELCSAAEARFPAPARPQRACRTC